MTNPNDPAFPSRNYIAKLSDLDLPMGLTMREYFAAMAMQGFIANPKNWLGFKPEDDANYILKLADALIKELSK